MMWKWLLSRGRHGALYVIKTNLEPWLLMWLQRACNSQKGVGELLINFHHVAMSNTHGKSMIQQQFLPLVCSTIASSVRKVQMAIKILRLARYAFVYPPLQQDVCTHTRIRFSFYTPQVSRRWANSTLQYVSHPHHCSIWCLLTRGLFYQRCTTYARLL